MALLSKATAVFGYVDGVAMVEVIESASVLLGFSLAWLSRPSSAVAVVSSLLASKEVSKTELAFEPVLLFLNIATSFLD